MLLEFKLSMPCNNAWNGRWTGEDNYYGRIIKLTKEKAQPILDKGYFTYNFGDGWVARIDIKKVDAREASKLRKKTKGFYGYDWMIRSILDNNEIKS